MSEFFSQDKPLSLFCVHGPTLLGDGNKYMYEYGHTHVYMMTYSVYSDWVVIVKDLHLWLGFVPTLNLLVLINGDVIIISSIFLIQSAL